MFWKKLNDDSQKVSNVSKFTTYKTKWAERGRTFGQTEKNYKKILAAGHNDSNLLHENGHLKVYFLFLLILW